MREIREKIREELASVLTSYMREKNPEAQACASASIVLEVPPDPALGDFAFPCFPLAKSLRSAPPLIAAELAKRLEASTGGRSWSVAAAGPYLNIRLERRAVVQDFLSASMDDLWGANGSLAGKRVMVEFSCPNTNKPLHLGHLRNDALGESVSRVLAASGAEVQKVEIINDRGIHICKSMLSYMQYGEGKSPESEGVKSDHFVGSYYVRFNKLKEEDPKADERAQALLQLWESGDAATIDLWKKMNAWTIEGMNATYERTGISFDKVYLESQTYLKGKDEVLRGLEKGIFYRADDGSIRIDMADIGLDTKVLLRSDGTSIYITQDIGTAIDRHKDWPFDRLVYVVACEQQYHFKVLFHILKKLGYEWADQLYHLSYGLVNLPEGRMKTREGTVVDADDLIDQLHGLAMEEITAKGREEDVGNPDEVAEKIALGALHYFLLQATPTKDMIFNPQESLAFNGNTGPYIQYMGARIESMLRKSKDKKLGKARAELLSEESEWELVKLMVSFPELVAQAALEMNPALIASRLYELAAAFSRFYHDCPILNHEDPDMAASRLELSRRVLHTLKSGMRLCLIPHLETM